MRTPPTSRTRHRSRWCLARNPVHRPSGGRVHLPPFHGWNTTLRTSLTEVRVLPVAPRAQPATARDVHALHRLGRPGPPKPMRQGSIPWRCATTRSRRAHMPPSRGWDTTLRTSLARVRVLPVARHARHAASSGEGERLISARGGLDSLRCDSRGAHLYLLARRRAAHGWLLVLLVRIQSPRPAQVTTRGCSSTVEQNIV